MSFNLSSCADMLLNFATKIIELTVLLTLIQRQKLTLEFAYNFQIKPTEAPHHKSRLSKGTLDFTDCAK